MAVIHIALFQCDHLAPSVAAKSGDYPQVFDALFRASFPADTTFTFQVDVFDVRDQMKYPEDIDQYQAIVYTGSAASAYENLDWINKLVEYTAYVAEQKPNIKLIGICFGHQIISRALGSECVPNDGRWEVGPTTLQLTDLGKRLFGVETLIIQQMHRDHVPEVPSSCQSLGSTSVTPNQGFIRYKPNAPPTPSPSDIQIFTVQGHPEFTETIVSAVVDLRESTGVFSNEVAADARRRAHWRNDGDTVIARLIWKIIGVI